MSTLRQFGKYEKRKNGLRSAFELVEYKTIDIEKDICFVEYDSHLRMVVIHTLTDQFHDRMLMVEFIDLLEYLHIPVQKFDVSTFIVGDLKTKVKFVDYKKYLIHFTPEGSASPVTCTYALVAEKYLLENFPRPVKEKNELPIIGSLFSKG